ncbi:TonB-dependent receptor domain-containing protein [Tsuneonella sp. HG222]
MKTPVVVSRPALAALALGLFPASAWAQGSGDAPPPVATETASAGEVYLPADFARFAPRNALDMVNQIPGFAVQQQDQGRGLGQANQNVLVNSERPASKSEGIAAQLSRINADRVVRIEIVDGASLGIPGLAGQVANVITRTGDISGRFDYRAVARPKYARPSFGGGEVSLTGSSGNVEWTAAFNHGVGRGGAGGLGTYLYDGNGNILETRDTLLYFKGEFPSLTGRIKWTSAGGTIVNARAIYGRSWTRFVHDEQRDLPTGVDRFRDFTNIDNGYNYELGADADFALGPGRLKLIGLERFELGEGPATSVLIYADGSPSTGSRFDQVRRTGERIARAEYAWNMLDGSWQFDAEAAFNRYRAVSTFETLDPSGAFVDVPFPGATGGVTEDRYEAILTHNRSLAGNLTLQAGLGGEYSRLAQTGPGGLTREFWRPKGSLTLAWTPQTGFDLSLKLARTVGQLAFGDFLASVNLTQNNETAGNVVLVPQQAWSVELDAKKNLGAWGSLNVRAYGRLIEDYIDYIPVPGGESRGNIAGNARLLGLFANATINLDPLGWKGAKITSASTYEASRLDDPLTGMGRPFSGIRDFRNDTTLRWDVPASDWAFGVGMNVNHSQPFVRLSETSKDYEGPVYTFGFVEHKDVLGLTVNLNVFNLTDGHAFFRRTVYSGLRDRSPIVSVEDRRIGVSQIFRLQVKGSF